MKKLIIAGSSKMPERTAYWRGYFEGRGYDVIDCPGAIPWDEEHASALTDMYCSFYQNLDRADVFFLMNEDKNNIGGYIGPSAIAELTYVVIGNLNRGKKVEINILQMPSEEQPCYEEVKFWLSQGWINIYDRPTGKKAAIPVPSVVSEDTDSNDANVEDEDDTLTESNFPDEVPAAPAVAAPRPHASLFNNLHSSEKLINLRTCKKRCLRNLNPMQREFLQALAPEFPAWLLKYIAAPEFQRLNGVSMNSGVDNGGLYNYANQNTVFSHSIGVALIIWRFTHDKRQTLSALFHDIASPAFKHTIDYLNEDAETQESIEERTSEIIRNSRVIMRQLKRDEIMAGEISDCKLYPLADNDSPNLAADRLEYTFSNGYFYYEAWTLDQIKRIMDDIVVLKNENDIDELGFHSLDICKEFTKTNLSFCGNYHSDNARATMQFMADIIKSMMLHDYLTMDDLYAMNEREVVDWILSCGDKTLSEAFRNFQRSTSIYASSTAKKDRYCTNVKAKVRYIVPLVQDPDAETSQRITEVSASTHRAVKKYLDTKTSKYVGFDFEFTPYSE